MTESGTLSVAVIGAGPAGLATAKTLNQYRRSDGQGVKVRVSIFEQTSRVGGLWPLQQDDNNGLIHPLMPTNLSKYSVAFSDLDWTSVRCDDVEGQGVPLYPEAWKVGRYLETYASRYNLIKDIRLRRKVTSAKLIRDRQGQRPVWCLTVHDLSHDDVRDSQCLYFDHVVVCTGFFAVPKSMQVPVVLDDNTALGGGRPSDACPLPPIMHSSQYRGLDQTKSSIGLHGSTQAPANIVVIGGANSAGEVSSMIARDVEDRYGSSTANAIRVQHVTPHGLYPVPLMLSNINDAQRSTIPRDFAFCNLASRPQGPILAGAGIPPLEVMKMRHAGVQKLAGINASELPTALQTGEIDDAEALCVTLCDKYYDYIKSERIIPIRERASELCFSRTNQNTWSLTLDEGTRISDVAAVVLATGFKSTPAADILDEEVLQTLQYDVDCPRIPFKLAEYQTSNPNIPSLGFVGMFEGLHWGIVEMQARILADKWLNPQNTINLSLQTSFEQPEKMDELRTLLKQKVKGAPQYWFSDHAGYMEEIARALDLPRMDDERVCLHKTFGPREGPAIPARYLTPCAKEEDMQNAKREAQKSMSSVYSYLYATT